MHLPFPGLGLPGETVTLYKNAKRVMEHFIVVLLDFPSLIYLNKTP